MAKRYYNIKKMTRGLGFFGISCIKQNLPESELRHYSNRARPIHGFMYIACETAVFNTTDGKTYTFRKNNLVYIPKGIKYTAEFYGKTTVDFTDLQLTFHLLDRSGNEYYISDYPVCLLEDTPESIIGYMLDIAYETINSEYPTFRIGHLFFKMMESVSKLMWLPEVSESGNKVMPAIYYLSRHLRDDISVPYLAKLCMMSESAFRIAFKDATGQSPALYKSTIKIAKARELIRINTAISTATLVEELGFNDTSYFYKTFQRITGMTLKEYRNSVK